MKKGMIILVLVGILLVLPLIQAQTYSGFERVADNVNLFLSSGDNKVRLALEIREKEVNSAMENTLNGNEENSDKNLKSAWETLQLIQEKVTLNTAEEIKESSDGIIGLINEEGDLSEDFDVYVLEEEKTGLTAEFTLKTFEYCKALAQKDYSAMLKQERCNPETAPKWLEKELKELKQIQEESFTELMLDIRSCIDDPGTCNCEDNTEIAQKAKCEKMVALAVKCEYKDDEDACDKLKSMKPVEGDDFAESFVPDFLMNLFTEKQDMIDYNIQKSDVPEECYNANTKPECEQYMHMKETRAKCWDKEGNFNYEKCGGPKEDAPTMQESIPQCYDENNQFLTAKCGKITIIWNEEGLINYIIENEISNIKK